MINSSLAYHSMENSRVEIAQVQLLSESYTCKVQHYHYSSHRVRYQ